MPSYAITGGRGLGFEFAKQISDNASNIVISLVRSIQKAEDLQRLANERSNVHIVHADLTHLSSLKRAAQEVAAITGGTLDVLINNAAWMREGAQDWKTLSQFEGHEDDLVEQLNAAFSTNVIGVIHTINAFLPLLKAGTLKQVITITSGMGDVPFVLKAQIPLNAPYAISKAAVNMVTAKYAAEFGEEGFTFVALCPGRVSTGLPPMSAEQMAKLVGMLTTIKRNVPSFPDPITPEESVKALMEVIDTLKPEENGKVMRAGRETSWI